MKNLVFKFGLGIVITMTAIAVLSVKNIAYAQDVGFEIIPESTSSNDNIGATVERIGEGGKVWDNYKDVAYGKKVGGNTRKGSDMSLGDQFASGIMTWDTILDYAVYLVKFIGQLALLAGALGFIYFGYKKATEHLKFGGTLGNITIGILVISFAYVIIKLIWSMFVS